MRVLMILLAMLFSSGAFAHGSSHPSCGGIKRDDDQVGYEQCKARQEAASRKKFNDCMANTECRTAYVNREKYFMWFFRFWGGMIALGVLYLITPQKRLNAIWEKLKWPK